MPWGLILRFALPLFFKGELVGVMPRGLILRFALPLFFKGELEGVMLWGLILRFALPLFFKGELEGVMLWLFCLSADASSGGFSSRDSSVRRSQKINSLGRKC